MTQARQLLVMAVLLTLGCDSLTGPQVLPLRFTTPSSDSSAAPIGIPGGIRVSGEFLTSCQPYSVTASATKQAQVVTLAVTGHPLDGCPMDVVGSLGYTAEISGLTSGGYRFELVHDDGMGGRVTRLDTGVSVP